jgi:hypothetical protein
MRRFELRISDEQRRQYAVLAVLVGALLFLISLFLDWYSWEFSSEEVEERVVGATFDGWSALDVLAPVMLIAALAMVALVLRPRERDARPTGLAPLGVGFFVVVLMFVIKKTPSLSALTDLFGTAGGTELEFETSLPTEVGVWVALAGALLLAIGGVLAELVDAVGERREAKGAQPAGADVPPAAPSGSSGSGSA